MGQPTYGFQNVVQASSCSCIQQNNDKWRAILSGFGLLAQCYVLIDSALNCFMTYKWHNNRRSFKASQCGSQDLPTLGSYWMRHATGFLLNNMTPAAQTMKEWAAMAPGTIIVMMERLMKCERMETFLISVMDPRSKRKLTVETWSLWTGKYLEKFIVAQNVYAYIYVYMYRKLTMLFLYESRALPILLSIAVSSSIYDQSDNN